MSRNEKVRTAILDLWSEDVAARLRAVESLYKSVSEMADIRWAQPALTLLLADPDRRIRKAALTTIEYRADLGADIGMAVPMLERLLDDENEEIQEIAWQAIQHADQRLRGISEIIEHKRPEFLFSRTTRTTVFPSGGPEAMLRSRSSDGTLADEPGVSPEMRAFFVALVAGNDIDTRTEAALSDEDDYNSIRAAAYLLEFLGRPNLWPGEPAKLRRWIERAIHLLSAMVDAASDDSNREFSERWGDVQGLIASVERQIAALSPLLPR